MGMWKWGLCVCLLLALPVAKAGSDVDPYSCEAYLNWLGLNDWLQVYRAALDLPGITEERRKLLETEIEAMQRDHDRLKKALLFDAPTVKPSPSGTTRYRGTSRTQLEPANSGVLDRIFAIRPQAKDATDTGAKRLILTANGQGLVVVPNDSRQVHMWDLRPEKRTYYTVGHTREVTDAAIDWNGDALVLDASQTLRLYTVPTAKRIEGRVAMIRAHAIALSGYSTLALNDGLHVSTTGVHTGFRQVDYPIERGGTLLRVTRDLKFAAIVTHDNNVKMVHLSTRHEIPMPAPVFDGKILDLQFSPDKPQWVALTENGQLVRWRWRPDGPSEYETFFLKELDAKALAMDVADQVVVAGNAHGLEGMIVGVDLSLREETGRYRTEQEGGITAVTLSSDSNTIVTASRHGGVICFFRNPAYYDIGD